MLPLQPPHPRRPVGIVLSAIALGLAAVFFVLLALSGLAIALGGGRSGAAGVPGSPITPAATSLLMLIFALIYAGVAAWAIATLVGLLRMRSWARISTIVIASCLIALGVLSAFGTLAARSAYASSSFPLPAGTTPDSVRKILAVMIAASLLVAVFGVLWLVYLTRRRLHDTFHQAHAAQLAARHAAHYPFSPGQHPSASGYPPAAWPAGPAWPQSAPVRPSPPAPDPLTDFTVARPLVTPPEPPTGVPTPEFPGASEAAYSAEPSAPPYNVPYDTPYAAPGYQPAPWPQPGPGWPGGYPAPIAAAPPGRPVLVTVLGVLALVSAFFSLVGVVSPLPAFLFGAIVSGWPLHLYSLVWAAAAAIAGLGMLRLQRPAWLLYFVLLGVSALHFLVMLLPGPRARYIAYMTAIQQHAAFGMPQPTLPSSFVAMTVALGILFGLAIVVTISILLWHVRGAFAPTPPPLPDDQPQV